MEPLSPFISTSYDNDDDNNNNTDDDGGSSYTMSQLHIDSNMEELQKRRKLTVDSGYGDDYTDGSGRMDLLSVDLGMTRTSSLDSITEGDSSFEITPATTTNDIIFKTMADKFQNLNAATTKNCHDNVETSPSGLTTCEMLSADLSPHLSSNVVTTKTKEKRRRMTPVPNSVTIARPSQGLNI